MKKERLLPTDYYQQVATGKFDNPLYDFSQS